MLYNKDYKIIDKAIPLESGISGHYTKILWLGSCQENKYSPELVVQGREMFVTSKTNVAKWKLAGCIKTNDY